MVRIAHLLESSAVTSMIVKLHAGVTFGFNRLWLVR